MVEAVVEVAAEVDLVAAVAAEAEEEAADRETKALLPKWSKRALSFMNVNPNSFVVGPSTIKFPILMLESTCRISVELAKWTRFWGKLSVTPSSLSRWIRVF